MLGGEAGAARATAMENPWQAPSKSLIRAAGASPDQGERGALRNIALTTELADEPVPRRRARRGACKATVRPAAPRVLLGPLRQASRLERRGGRRARFLGRSHRAAKPKAQLKEAIDRTARLLGVPADYRVGIVPASDTGAFEMAMWSMLGARPVDMLVWESFGQGWATDATKQLKLADCRVLSAPYGALPDLGAVRHGRRRLLHLERHHLGRPGAGRRLDRRRTATG